MQNIIESIGFEETDVQTFATTHMINNLLRRNGVLDKIDELIPITNVPGKQEKFKHSDCVAKLMTHYFMDYHRMSQMTLMDPNYKSLSFKSCVSYHTVKNRIKDLAEKPKVERITTTVSQYRKNGKLIKEKAKKEKHIPIYRLTVNDSILKLVDYLCFFSKNEPLIIDADATCIDTQSQDASRHYQGKMGYAPLVITINRIPIYVEMRTGSVNPGLFVEKAVIRVIKQLKNLGYTLQAVRLDGASYSKRTVDAFESFNLLYYIRASKIKESLQNMNPKSVMIDGKVVLYVDKVKKFGTRLVRYVYNNNNNDKRTVAIITNDHNIGAFDLVDTYCARASEEQVMSLLNCFGFDTMIFWKIKNNAAFLCYSVIMAVLFRYITKQYSIALGADKLSPYCTMSYFQNQFLKVKGRIDGSKLIILDPSKKEVFEKLMAA